jgi:DNA-directed RNA polymerase subunit RPC12/RpoP
MSDKNKKNIVRPVQREKTKKKIKVECPHCRNSEEIWIDNYKNPVEYKLFKASYNSFLASMNFICNNCGTKFKIESQMF